MPASCAAPLACASLGMALPPRASAEGRCHQGRSPGRDPLLWAHLRDVQSLSGGPACSPSCSDGAAKVGDVGMAKIMAGDYVSGVVGTLAW